MKKIIIIIFMWLGGESSFAQSLIPAKSEPIVGQPSPDFKFTQVDFYTKKEVTLADFKGKWLVLDFWSKTCSGCIGHFPDINKKQQEFKDKVQFLMVTYNDPEGVNRPLYTSYYQKLKLTMPCAFDGTMIHQVINQHNEYSFTGIFAQFHIGTLPHVVVIDPQGIVQAITTEISAENMQELMEGKKPVLSSATYDDERQKIGQYIYTPVGSPLLTNGNGGPDTAFTYRSLMAAWTPQIKGHIEDSLAHRYKHNTWQKNGTFEVLGANIGYLYQYAYAGTVFFDDSTKNRDWWRVPILEIKDNTAFKYNFATGENLYNYSLIVPPSRANEPFMMQVMRGDLKNYFGYDAVVENREMPCWYLIVRDSVKFKTLKTKGGANDIKVIKPYLEYTYLNYSLNQLAIAFQGLLYGTVLGDSPILGDPKANFHVDLENFQEAKRDFIGFMKEIHKNGLDLIKGTKMMKVIVVRDPKTEVSNN